MAWPHVCDLDSVLFSVKLFNAHTHNSPATSGHKKKSLQSCQTVPNMSKTSCLSVYLLLEETLKSLHSTNEEKLSAKQLRFKSALKYCCYALKRVQTCHHLMEVFRGFKVIISLAKPGLVAPSGLLSWVQIVLEPAVNIWSGSVRHETSESVMIRNENYSLLRSQKSCQCLFFFFFFFRILW